MTTEPTRADVKRFTIKRSKWLRGEAVLRDEDGCMCCLGFLGIACGISPEKLVLEGEPQQVPVPEWPEWLLYRDNGYPLNSFDCENLMSTNDDPEISEAEREKEIARLFTLHEIEVTFIP